ncbi:hypothetical protein [Peribacillus sp. FSL P2-0133]|uniref:hypothetical protein n=1 Tax=Peribacillus sp. FSL P2-0133 TaxID=2921573 RepID=UPI0030CF4C65
MLIFSNFSVSKLVSTCHPLIYMGLSNKRAIFLIFEKRLGTTYEMVEWKFQMDFYDILKDTFAKGESGQDVTVNELVEEIKEKLSGIIEEPERI